MHDILAKTVGKMYLFERITIGRIDRVIGVINNRWYGCSIYKPIPSLYTEQHK
jgi:hypothetical protein